MIYIFKLSILTHTGCSWFFSQCLCTRSTRRPAPAVCVGLMAGQVTEIAIFFGPHRAFVIILGYDSLIGLVWVEAKISAVYILGRHIFLRNLQPFPFQTLIGFHNYPAWHEGSWPYWFSRGMGAWELCEGAFAWWQWFAVCGRGQWMCQNLLWRTGPFDS